MQRRYLVHYVQFVHAWLLSRVLVHIFSRRHPLDALPTLIVSPHPDDETLGCGGLIVAKRTANARVTILFLTDGSKGTLDPRHPPSPRLAEKRRLEATAAAEHLGVDRSHIHFWDYPDGDLVALPAETREVMVARLAALIRTEEIASVYVPHRGDGHPDHEFACALGESAVARAGTRANLFQYAIWMWWSRVVFFRLRLRDLARMSRHPVGPAIKQKHLALQSHVSQLPRFPPGFLTALPFSDELFFELLPDHGLQSSPPAPAVKPVTKQD